MAKYFVHGGMPFKTVEVTPASFGVMGNDNLDSVDMISVAKALGTDIIAGADDDALKATLVAVWNGSQTAGSIQDLNQDILDETAPLNQSATPGTGDDASEAATINYLSWQYILPPGFTDVLYTLPDYDSTNAAATLTNRREYALVKSLEVRHNNIRKHSSEAAAFEAWRRYIVATEASSDRSQAESGYLINRSASNTD